jgi:uncharacterized repeat protein (TIGR01451 family)
MIRPTTLFLSLLAVTVLASAQGTGDVTSTLSVTRIVVGKDGKETRTGADSAKPGDVLEYVAEYRNTGKSPARKLEATLPIPSGTELLAATARPAEVRASLDGAKFEPVPLKRKVKRADGSMAEEPVPYSEYRFLRWAPRDLAAGRSARFSARVRLVTEPPAVAPTS